MTFKFKIALFSSAALLLLSFGLAKALSIPAVSIPDQGYQFDTTLAVGIGASDTSMTLSLGTWKNGTSLSGYQCFTMDAGTTKNEYVCGTASGTAITSLLRGVDPLNPLTQVTALKFSHRAGADVRITDFPGLQIVKRLGNGQDPFPNPLLYDAAVSTTTLQSNTLYMASVAYVNGVALQGAPTATTSVPGVIQIGTTAQIAAGTGMTGVYTLVPAGSLFSQAYRSATTVPVTNATGTLASGFIDQTANYTWSGTQTFNASSTVVFSGSTSFTAAPSGLGIINTYTASTTLTGATLPQAVVLATTTHAVLLASSTDQTAVDFFGFAVSNASNGGTVSVETDGIVNGFSGLTAGLDYYVASGTAGTVSSTPGVYEIKVGTAISATQILIKKGTWQYMGGANFSGAPTQTVTSPALARFAIVVIDGAGTNIAAHGVITISRYGATGGTQGSRGTSADNDSTVSASWSGNTISLAGNGMTSVNGTVNFYR